MFKNLLSGVAVAFSLAIATVSIAQTGSGDFQITEEARPFVGTWVEGSPEGTRGIRLNADGTASAINLDEVAYSNWRYEDGKLYLTDATQKQVVLWADAFMDGGFWASETNGVWETVYRRQ